MKITDIDEYRPHEVAELVCLKCLKRWIAVYPSSSLLKDLECPKCHESGYAIMTGQELDAPGK